MLVYLVDLQEQFLELVLRRPEAHGPHDLPQVVGGQEVNLLSVEQVETHLGATMQICISVEFRSDVFCCENLHQLTLLSPPKLFNDKDGMDGILRLSPGVVYCDLVCDEMH